jgi:aryl-alcohol dehydrogenase-like predicted oxidoreductase
VTGIGYRRLGRTGPLVSALAIGSAMAAGAVDYRAGAAAVPSGTDAPERFIRGVRRAVEAGITTFDTAAAYAGGRAEELLAEALSGVARDGLVLITKVYFPTGPAPHERGLGRAHVLSCLDGSLRRLGTDHVDVYLAHRYDERTPLAETIEAFADVVRAGKALHIGVSGWTPDQIRAAVALAEPLGVPLVCDQVVHHMADRSATAEVTAVCADVGAGLMACSPLGGGLLTGKYRAGHPAPGGSRGAGPGRGRLAGALADEELLGRIERLAPLAGDVGLTTAGLAVAWALRAPGMASAVVGLAGPGQLTELVAGAGVRLDEDLIAKIDDVLDR